MTRVLVTGGTGRLGRELVPRLRQAGHDVRALSRGGDIRGDVRTGAGLAAAVVDVEVVVHAVVPRRRQRDTEVNGTSNVIDAAARVNAHLIYVSIVGVDHHRFPYYRYKYAAERLIEASGLPFTIQRATQFHPLLDEIFARGVFVRTPNLAFQPVDPGEVADRVARLVAERPAGRVPDFGGPEVLPIGQLTRTRAEITGRKTRLVRVPKVGMFRDFDDGRQLCPDHREGSVTWAQWLAAHVTG